MTTTTTDNDSTIDFFWDPICPFAWVTSRFVHVVKAEVSLNVNWRPLSLALLNRERDYDELPDGYKASHGRGLKLLRIAAAVQESHGADALEDLYSRFGEAVWNVDQETFARHYNDRDIFDAAPILAELGLPEALADESDNSDWDAFLETETALSLERTGGDTGTPVITFDPPDGPSFFGPVITRVPEPDEAVEVWRAFQTLARWPSFSEVKRSAREVPHLPAFGFRTGTWTVAEGLRYDDE